MEPEGSLLLYSQEPSTELCLETDESSLHSYTLLNCVNSISHLCLGLPDGSSFEVFQSKLYVHLSSPMHVACPVHSILLDLIVTIILVKFKF
jgi:hypothetical protein